MKYSAPNFDIGFDPDFDLIFHLYFRFCFFKRLLRIYFQSVAQIHAKLDVLTGTRDKLQTDLQGPLGIEERLQDVTEHTNEQDSMKIKNCEEKLNF